MADLGFSDLTEDEALLVSLYREWVSKHLVQHTFERKMSLTLANDALHHVLDDVFAIFQHVPTDEVPVCGVGDLLSDHEELLLDAVSMHLSRPIKKIGKNRVPMIRPTIEISRTDRDILRFRVNQSNWCVALNL